MDVHIPPLHFSPRCMFSCCTGKNERMGMGEVAWSELVAQTAPSHSSIKASEYSSSTVPAGSHVIRLEFNHCFKKQSSFYSVRPSRLSLTHTDTQFCLVYFIQVKQELGLKTILTQEFMLGDSVSFLSLPVCFYWKGYCMVIKMGLYINLQEKFNLELKTFINPVSSNWTYCQFLVENVFCYMHPAGTNRSELWQSCASFL